MAQRVAGRTRKILELFVAEPRKERYGLEVVRETGVGVSAVYATLRRLEDEGVLSSRWQTDQPPGRPPHHYYRLTNEGRRLARERLQAAERRATSLAPGFAPA